MLAAIGHESLARPDGRRGAEADPHRRHRSTCSTGAPRRGRRDRAAGARRAQQAARADDRARLPRHDHAAVIRRNVLEDPSWYTAYTPYQPEISQGRLEALLNFQTMVADLTGLATANASLLDEGTAVAEAMTLVRRAKPKAAGPFVVDADALPQTIAVVRTRAEAMGIDVVVADLADGLPDGDLSGVLRAVPRRVRPDPRPARAGRGRHGPAAGSSVVAADLLALTLLESPGALGADVVVGSSQRFGVPLFYGGPHAGFMAVATGLERHLPGRLVGVSVDAARQARLPARAADPRAAHPPRQGDLQHLHRPGAARGHGRDVRRLPRSRGADRDRTAYPPLRDGARDRAAGGRRRARARASSSTPSSPGSPGGRPPWSMRPTWPGCTCGASTPTASASPAPSARRSTHVATVLTAFGLEADSLIDVDVRTPDALPGELLPHQRRSSTHPVFNTHHSETAMLRYLRRLSARDYALDRGMIPLGSCTMKLNATTEMEPISLPGFADLHPFAPAEDAEGYRRADRPTSKAGWPRSPATTGSRSSRTPARRASSPGCSRSAATTARNGDAARDVCLIPSSRARHQRRVRGDGRHAGRRGQGRRPTARSTSTTCAPSARRTPTTWPRSW